MHDCEYDVNKVGKVICMLRHVSTDAYDTASHGMAPDLPCSDSRMIGWNSGMTSAIKRKIPKHPVSIMSPYGTAK